MTFQPNLSSALPNGIKFAGLQFHLRPIYTNINFTPLVVSHFHLFAVFAVSFHCLAVWRFHKSLLNEIKSYVKKKHAIQVYKRRISRLLVQGIKRQVKQGKINVNGNIIV